MKLVKSLDCNYIKKQRELKDQQKMMKDNQVMYEFQ